ncbi:uncharacterized protein BYT42DRAFT_594946 [Radiomyces spectabilis]|uniref:uncharacterized protein n=1 Tax=Radiomyces spectabilis TaxID=64574 RepID=UPI00221FB839|nr:uncharacterized protein BYT42DRAFT_594946 [Radiomyces spectabilis]KAI8371338.1 hypothetical protein BYT42DRAFT_594946 [Radiomyces spectabilis]
MPVTPNYIAPRAPIALCHGLYGFDKRGPELFPLLQVHYWGGIEEALAKLGAKVIGGLDCRYLVSHIKNRPYHVQSLTTISTPHRGSPVMDWFRDHVGVGMTDALVDAATRKMETNNTAAKKTAYDEGSIVSARLPLLSWTLADIAKMPSNLLDPVVSKVVQLLDTPAYANLTTDYCKHHFNPNTPDDPNVAYYSYGASTELPVWSFLGLPNQLVKEKEGENDGLVSVESAKWGKYIKTVKADHWDLNGQRYRWRSSKPSDSGFNTVEFYLELATHLYHQGH